MVCTSIQEVDPRASEFSPGQTQNLSMKDAIRVRYCMVCKYVREDNPRALASEFSPVHTQKHTITCLLHQYAYCRHLVQ